MTIIMNKERYWCDVCYKKGISDDGMTETKSYYGCYHPRDWGTHSSSSKHQKLLKAVNEDPNSIKCKHCNQRFSEEGYKIHSGRNKPLWDFQKIGSCMMMTCNNFKEGGKRYETIDEYVESKLPKQKQKRTGVGKWSPITGITRPPNKPKGWKDNEKIEVENEYTLCKNCDGMFNVEVERSDKELMKITSLKMAT